ncbi:unnamed protein product [Miscanthus lutarioriparius]|uniref:Nucleolar protein 58/56 N-terminal domain-containing protein n=1 Tax=Miscanthus lutarioriparius TaxID=422564 RepID=A0A811N4P5_9POAL|nr:unnamed protein product [Miscanthus lutarioriparius]
MVVKAEGSPSKARWKEKVVKAEEALPSTPRGEGKVVKAKASPSRAWQEGKEKKAEETADREEESEEELEQGDEDDVEEYENWNYFPGLGVELGNNGIILVLFETPSGFALFSYDGVKLLLPGAIEHIWTDFVKCDIAETICWLKAFEAFEDKASAIDPNTGVNEQLAKMIRCCIKPDQKLAVGSHEYKEIIEKTMKISCLHDSTVMEVMWGLKNCMHHLVPAELTKDDRPLMSEGMKRVLDKYHFIYKPEIINDRIIEVACVVYNYDCCVEKHSESLREAGKHLKNISGINSEGWSLFKLATALKMVCYPEDHLLAGHRQIFSEDELKKLLQNAPEYKDKLKPKAVKLVYEDIVWALGIRNKWLGQLPRYLKEAEEAYEAKQVMSQVILED